MKAWGITDTGCVRQENQDSYFIDILNETGQAICVVCDGMGGARSGNVASRMAVRYFISEIKGKLRPATSSEELSGIARDAVDMANSAVFETSIHNESCFGMGTTLVSATVTDNNAVIMNIGDSRAYFLNSSGIKLITRDHSVVEDMIARGDISRKDARKHPIKNLITRAVGTESTVVPDVFHLELEKGDYLLLCSDGLSNVITDPEILFEVLHGGPPDSCCYRLLNIAISRGAPDNVTVVLMQA